MTPPLDTIRALLESHRTADASESDSLRRIHDLIGGAANPFSREHYAPGHLTSSAIVLNAERSRTLLIFHAKLQRWLQPGGHFEPGEFDPSVTSAREVLEETGLRTRWPGERPLLLDVDVHEIPARKNEPAHGHFDLRMLLIADAGDVTPCDVIEARWCEPREFDALKLDPGTVRALRKCGLG